MSHTKAGAAPVGRADVAEARRPVSVLVVDDDEDIRETLAELLQDEGYTVVTAANGAAALDLLRIFLPQVILLDLSMPVMSGQQFRREQLADPTLVSIPTIVMSAADRIQEKTAGMQLNELLAKPIKMQDLLASVGRHCPREP